MKSSPIQENQPIDHMKVWWIASRPRVLAISVSTVSVGTALAYKMQGFIDWSLAGIALLFSLFIQIATHFINDALDFKKGVDTAQRIGFPKVTQLGLASPQYMLMSGYVCLGLAFLLGIPLVYHGGWPLIFILLVCVANGYLYTGGTYSLSYTGLGDLFAFLFFGLVGTGVVYYLQTGQMSLLVLLGGAQVGLLSSVITATNNLRDIVGDALANKRTVAVRFGKRVARLEITAMILLAFMLGMGWMSQGYTFSALLPSFMLPLALRIIKQIWTTEPSAKYNQILVMCVVLQFFFSLLLVISYLI